MMQAPTAIAAKPTTDAIVTLTLIQSPGDRRTVSTKLPKRMRLIISADTATIKHGLIRDTFIDNSPFLES
jgi:hypothetical protein